MNQYCQKKRNTKLFNIECMNPALEEEERERRSEGARARLTEEKETARKGSGGILGELYLYI